MTPKAARIRSRRWRAAPLALLVGALAASTAAGAAARGFWRRLPEHSVRAVTPAQLQAAIDRANASMSADAREALALRRASLALLHALTGRAEPARLQAEVNAAAVGVRESRLIRLQQGAVRLWLAERAGEPVENWWPALQPYLAGMQQADCAHHQAALVEHWTAVYRHAGLGPGTAAGLAEEVVGQAHGPFVQYLAGRLQLLIGHLERTGDAVAAATCRAVLHHLLKQWVLEPGPAGLRLLAADLLAAAIDAADPAHTTDTARAVADDLRAWRSAYQCVARRRPAASLDPRRRLCLAPDAHDRLLARTGLVTWLASAALAAALVALLLSPAWLRCGVTGWRRLTAGVLLAAALVIAGGLVWTCLWPEAVQADLRRDFSAPLYWPRHPFVAAAVTLVLMLPGALLQPRAGDGQSSRRAGAGKMACGVWLLLALAVWSAAGLAESARRSYERQTAAAYEDVVTALGGPETDRLLARLWRWEP